MDKKLGPTVKAFDFLSRCEDEKLTFSAEELVAHTGWKARTVSTYFRKKWSHFLTHASDSRYHIRGISALGLAGFIKLQSQKLDTTGEPLRPRFGQKVDHLLDKSRESALLAVSIFNNPTLKFRTHGYIVQMEIAWLALFHALFERRQIKYFHRANDGSVIWIDGDEKAWELAKCIEEFWKDARPPIRANLEFLIGLRNKIEHRFLPALDLNFSDRCQSLLTNFETLLTEEFGDYFSLQTSLALSLQLSRITQAAQREALRSMQTKQYELIRRYIKDFESALPPETLENQDYRLRVFVIPKRGNHESSSEIALEVVRYDPNDPASMADYEKMVELIRERPSKTSIYSLRPHDVVEQVAARIPNRFRMREHTLAWSYYRARPRGTDAAGCDANHCAWVEGHDGYLFTKQWVEFLVKKLSDASEYAALVASGSRSQGCT